MVAVSRVLIVGGGIGGLTAAVALRRNGIAVDVVELDAKWAVYGVGIMQPNNVLCALDRIGLARRCVEHGASSPGWRIFDREGNHLMDARSSNEAAPQYPPINGITRPLLQEILSSAAIEAGTRIRLGLTVDALDDEGDVVRVHFSDGTEADYDFVIGADGIYSRVRSLLFGEVYSPQFVGQSVWRYNLPRPPEVTWGSLYQGPNSKVGLVPLSPTLMYIFVVTAEPGNPWIDKGQLASLMHDRIQGYGGIVAELRDQITVSSKVVYKPIEHLLLPEPWGMGRIWLIGDAAHATTPHLNQGAAMAIEDAVVLAELLARNESVDSLMTEFMGRRFARVKDVVDTSARIASLELAEWGGVVDPEERPGVLLSEASLRLTKKYWID
jgi:2-polyprenyl-6-methoxyphenol hydroxylase-like FAD-dependent oxidoreductase